MPQGVFSLSLIHILINNMDEESIRFFLADDDLKGIQYVHGDFSEEFTLEKANAMYASKALILGEDQDGLSPELVDSIMFILLCLYLCTNMYFGIHAAKHQCSCKHSRIHQLRT